MCNVDCRLQVVGGGAIHWDDVMDDTHQDVSTQPAQLTQWPAEASVQSKCVSRGEAHWPTLAYVRVSLPWQKIAINRDETLDIVCVGVSGLESLECGAQAELRTLHS